MSTFSSIIMLCFSTLLVNNIIFSSGLGTSTLLSIVRLRKNILSFGLSVTYFTTVSGVIMYFVNKYVYKKYDIMLYEPLIFVVVLGIVYIISILVLWKCFNKVFDAIKPVVHISAFNCAVYGAVCMSILKNKTFAEYLFYGIFSGIGFSLALFMVASVYERLTSDKAPISFRGYPLFLIYLGIIGMALYGIGVKYNF